MLISVGGLAPAMALLMLCAAYLGHEFSFDPFVRAPEQVVAVTAVLGGADISPFTVQNAPALLKSEIDTRFGRGLITARACPQDTLVRTGDQATPQELNGLFVDPEFLSIMTLPVSDRPSGQELGRDEVLLRADTAQRLFGSRPAIGQTLQVAGQPALVTGILAPLPSNVSLTAEMILSTFHPASPTHGFERRARWADFVCPLWARATDPLQGAELSGWLDRLVPEKYAAELATGEKYSFRLVGLRDLHFATDILQEGPASDQRGKGGLILLACATLATFAVALVNFFSLTSARLVRRTREMALRRVLGAATLPVLRVLLAEPAMIAGFSLLLAAALAEQTDAILRTHLGIDLSGTAVGLWLAGLAGLAGLLGCLGTALLAGWRTGTLPLALALRGETGRHVSRSSWALWLVGLQFMMSLLALSITLVVADQAAFALRHGIERADASALAVVSGIRGLGEAPERQRFVDRLNGLGGGIQVAGSSHVPGESAASTVSSRRLRQDGVAVTLSIVRADPGFFDLYGARLLAGRLYAALPWVPDHPRPALIDMTSLRALGLSDPADAIGRVIGAPDDGLWIEVTGVIADMEMYSIHQVPLPTIYYADPGWTRHVTVRLPLASIITDLGRVEDVWQGLAGGRRFTAELLGERMRRLGRPLLWEAALLGAMGTLTAILSCVGLVALVTLEQLRGAKETAIRKIMGASTIDIARLLYVRMGRLLLPSFGLAAPLALLLAVMWRQTFAVQGDGSVVLPLAIACLSLTATAMIATLPIVVFFSRRRPAVLLRENG